MILYVYLVIYHDQGRRRAPAHWAILITDREAKQEGTVYHAVGSPFHGYNAEIKRDYNLAATRRRHTIVLLGYIDEAWMSSLDAAVYSIPTPGKSPTPLDPFAGENCQTWVWNFVQYLVNLGAMDQSAISLLGTASRE